MSDEEEEDPEDDFQEVEGMPGPPDPKPDLENPLYSPTHVSVYFTNDDPLVNKNKFEELDLSPVNEQYATTSH